MHFLNESKINSLIFDNILTLFPKFANAINEFKVKGNRETLMIGEVGDFDLNLTVNSYLENKECYLVSLFTEIEINKKLIKYPEIMLGVDLANKRAEVLEYKCEMYPYTALKVYNTYKGNVFINKMAHKDLSLFCCNWLGKYMKQHSLIWKNTKTA